jgi:mannosyltransferase OCH1-like enzyme
MIPKIIYMCDKTLNFIQKYSQNWTKLNPDYEIRLYDNALCEKFLLDNYSQLHYDIFRYIPDGPIKADFWRVCILYKYGGLYIDADNEPLVPLKDFIEEDVDFVTCNSYWNIMNFNPNFIMAKAGDTILEQCINMYITYYNQKKIYKYWDWSIMTIFSKIIKIDNYNKRKDAIYYIDNKKIQIICENPGKNHHDAHNIYNNIRVFNNRYKNYCFKYHAFKT